MIEDESYLEHYGTPRHSGRYPWGSGKDPYQRNASFLAKYKELVDQGVSEKDIAKGWDMTVRQLRAQKSISTNEKYLADQAMAVRLLEKGYSKTAIAKRLGVSEGKVRNMVNPALERKSQNAMATADILQKQIDKDRYVDVGLGTEHYMGVSNFTMGNAIHILEQKGYKVHNVKVEQLGTGKFTTVKVLGAPGTEWAEVQNNKDLIRPIEAWSTDGGSSYQRMQKPVAISSDRIMVRYGDEGGKAKDGVIELRRGVEDLSLGSSSYAQVRINVEDSHYLKGMAIYNDHMPPGVDIIFNTNKTSDKSKLEVMKPLNMKDGEVDAENPFGASVKQRMYIGADGKEHLSAINIVGAGETANEEGTWGGWKKTLSSQFLSKQSPELAKKQLALRYDALKEEYDEIMSLTNPTVRKHFLEEFADTCDGSSVHLEAAALPRQASHVILPLTTIKDTEIYAPGYENGEKVVLVRYPHGGKFEIPELTVNNNNAEGKSVVTPKALDAVGISSKVAEQLSGADFDGDTVLVIPNNKSGKYKIQTEHVLEDLKDFDPKTQYKLPDDAPEMSDQEKGIQMGMVSNLITDMTLAGADKREIARAVRHSMVVIDAQKHHLNYKQSAQDNDIQQLYDIYQHRDKGPSGGASTVISRASSRIDVPTRKTYTVDKETGKKIWIDKPNDFRDVPDKDKEGNIIGWHKERRMETSRKMLEVEDAYELTSGGSKEKTVHVMEHIYADHANRLKELANLARKEAANEPGIQKSSSAAETYKNEVASLKAQLNRAEKNAPKERYAQIIANVDFKARKDANPGWGREEIKKEKYRALERARDKLGVRKKDVEVKFSPKEWEAIQAGAISKTMLSQLLRHANKEDVKTLAMPKEKKTLTDSRISRAKAMLSAGCTLKEAADILGVSPSTLSKAVNS